MAVTTFCLAAEEALPLLKKPRPQSTVKNFMDPLGVVIDQARRPSTMAENRRFMNFFRAQYIY
jgi:hypothetical protein